MANYDSQDLKSRLIEMLALPTDDTGAIVSQQLGTTDAALYRNLSTAESDVQSDVAMRVPHALIAAPALLTSADGGKTYPYVDAAGTTVAAQGYMRVFTRLEDIPDSPLVEGVDYTNEGTKLRIPNNLTWTYSTGPYVQMIAATVPLSASVNPTLPSYMLMAVVYQAAVNFCQSGGKRDPSQFEKRYNDEITKLCLMYHSQVAPQGLSWGRTGHVRTLRWGGR